MGTVTGLQSVPVSLLLKKAERAFFEGDEKAAAAFLDRVRAQLPDTADEWVACARLNEMLCRLPEALEDYARALAPESDDGELRLKRARIFLELGHAAEAREEVKAALLAGTTKEKVRETLGVLLTRLAPPSDPEPQEIDRAFYQSRGRRRAIARFLELFQGRPGAYARQWFDPKEGRCGYFPVLEPLTPEVVEAHLQGKMTVGQYLLDAQARVHFAALDLDVGKEAISRVRSDEKYRRELAAAMRGLMARLSAVSSEWGIPLVFERSGHKGVHAWCFFEGPVPAWAAKELLTGLRDAVSPIPQGIHVEVFPKQVNLSKKGYGNLIKLPLGVHRVTRKRSVFLDARGVPIADSIQYLLEIRKVPAELVVSLANKLEAGKKGQVVPMRASEPSTGQVPKSKPAEAPETGHDRQAKEAYGIILQRCAMIRYLVRKAREFGHLSFDERKVVLGVLGHLPGGSRLVHHVISRCADYDPQITAHFISRMPRQPLGCRSIRRRLFYLEQTRCRCLFETAGKEYATPLLHLASWSKGDDIQVRGT